MPLKSHLPSKAWAMGRGDILLASDLTAVWSKGWVPKEERQDGGNEAVFFLCSTSCTGQAIAEIHPDSLDMHTAPPPPQRQDEQPPLQCPYLGKKLLWSCLAGIPSRRWLPVPEEAGKAAAASLGDLGSRRHK